MTETMKKTADILMNVLIALLLVVAIPLLVSRLLPGRKLPVVGGYQALVVQGGSMEPTIKLGSVIVIRAVDPAEVKVGDVITFLPPKGKQDDGSPAIATHRVVAVERQKVYGDAGTVSFRTKGDANEEQDMQAIGGASVLGKVVAAIPYAGYAVRFAKTPMGLVSMILVPGLLLATGGTTRFLAEVRQHRNSKTA